jgi:predicted ester cyclase
VTDQENLKAAHSFFAAWNAGDLSQMDSYEAVDAIAERPGAPGPMDQQSTRMYIQNFLTAFAGSQFEVWLTVADGEYVVDHWSVSGVNNGTLYSPSGQPIPPTGKSVTLKGTLTSQVRDGKVVRSWGYFDLASLLMQIGVVPEM